MPAGWCWPSQPTPDPLGRRQVGAKKSVATVSGAVPSRSIAFCSDAARWRGRRVLTAANLTIRYGPATAFAFGRVSVPTTILPEHLHRHSRLAHGIIGDTINVMRVVLDTSVLVAGWRSRNGASFEILRLVPHGIFELVVSVPLVVEYEAVLLRHRSGAQTAEHVTDLVDYLCAQAHHQAIFYLWRPCLSDPGDDMVLELAVAAQAQSIVTHNIKDFAVAEQFGITPIAPGAFLRTLMKG
jgi:putative PIN family toxin of toxin-antitoxin system